MMARRRMNFDLPLLATRNIPVILGGLLALGVIFGILDSVGSAVEAPSLGAAEIAHAPPTR